MQCAPNGLQCADIVAKVFLPLERAILIQDQAQMRNVDSKVYPPRFDCCAFLFHSIFSATFATVSAKRRHRRHGPRICRPRPSGGPEAEGLHVGSTAIATVGKFVSLETEDQRLSPASRQAVTPTPRSASLALASWALSSSAERFRLSRRKIAALA